MAENVEMEPLIPVEEREEEETTFIEGEDGEGLDLNTPDLNLMKQRVNEKETEDTTETDKTDSLNERWQELIQQTVEYFFDNLDVLLDPNDGSNSYDLINQMVPIYNKKLRKFGGAEYKGQKVLIVKKGKVEISENKTNPKLREAVKEFKRKFELAKEEHAATTAGQVEELAEVVLPPDVNQDIIEESISILEENINDLDEQIIISLSKDELCEMLSTAQISDDINENTTQAYSEDKLAAIKIDTEYWKQKALEAKAANEDERSRVFDMAAKSSELKEDHIRLKNGKHAETEEVQNIMREVIDDDPRTKFQKLKLWIKEHMTANVAILAVSVASLSIAIYYGMKNTAKGGANAIKGFGKALAKMAKTLGPIASALFAILSKVMQVGGSVLGFLADNIWILFLFILGFFLTYVSKRKAKSNQ
jgi:hypothetical protein